MLGPSPAQVNPLVLAWMVSHSLTQPWLLQALLSCKAVDDVRSVSLSLCLKLCWKQKTQRILDYRSLILTEVAMSCYNCHPRDFISQPPWPLKKKSWLIICYPDDATNGVCIYCPVVVFSLLRGVVVLTSHMSLVHTPAHVCRQSFPFPCLRSLKFLCSR